MRTEERHQLQEETSGSLDPAANGVPSDNDSLTAVLAGLAGIGFAASYRPARGPVEGRPAVVCGACGRASAAEDLRVDLERRLEGASEPDEMILVVAATCPACGTGGVMVLGYGPEASAEDSDLVLALLRPTKPDGRDAAASTSSSAGDDDDDASTSDPGGDSDPDANEGFEPPSDRSSAPGLGRIGTALDGAAALDRFADPVRQAIDQRLPDRARSVLQGRWLGHPVHPFMTDLVIGFWTSAWLLDIFGDERTDAAADAFVAAGVASAVPTAWAGWADWTALSRRKRRAGLVHAASNGTAIALYSASLIARRRGNRRAGIGLGHAGAAVATVGGYLGGHLAFGD